MRSIHGLAFNGLGGGLGRSARLVTLLYFCLSFDTLSIAAVSSFSLPMKWLTAGWSCCMASESGRFGFFIPESCFSMSFTLFCSCKRDFASLFWLAKFIASFSSAFASVDLSDCNFLSSLSSGPFICAREGILSELMFIFCSEGIFIEGMEILDGRLKEGIFRVEGRPSEVKEGRPGIFISGILNAVMFLVNALISP